MPAPVLDFGGQCCSCYLPPPRLFFFFFAQTLATSRWPKSSGFLSADPLSSCRSDSSDSCEQTLVWPGFRLVQVFHWSWIRCPRVSSSCCCCFLARPVLLWNQVDLLNWLIMILTQVLVTVTSVSSNLNASPKRWGRGLFWGMFRCPDPLDQVLIKSGWKVAYQFDCHCLKRLTRLHLVNTFQHTLTHIWPRLPNVTFGLTQLLLTLRKFCSILMILSHGI